MTYEETKLSVIIVNYNVKYFLEQCLYSVRAAVMGMDAEVFVVDNNSTDGSVEYLRPKFPEVVFIENKDNPGSPRPIIRRFASAPGNTCYC